MESDITTIHLNSGPFCTKNEIYIKEEEEETEYIAESCEKLFIDKEIYQETQKIIPEYETHFLTPSTSSVKEELSSERLSSEIDSRTTTPPTLSEIPKLKRELLDDGMDVLQ